MSMAGFAALALFALYSLRLVVELRLIVFLVVDCGSRICKAGFTSFLAALFLHVVVRPKMLRIMAGTHQKDSFAVCWFCW